MNSLTHKTFLTTANILGIGSGRLVPTIAAVLGLIGVVVGGYALARSMRRNGTGSARIDAGLGGLLALISLAVGVLHSSNVAGGFGTGNGLAGAIAAVVLGLIGLSLASLALAYHRLLGGAKKHDNTKSFPGSNQ
jgi:hypothetical protein